MPAGVRTLEPPAGDSVPRRRDDLLGDYLMLSLVSPVTEFEDQAAAEAVAEIALRTILTVPEDEKFGTNYDTEEEGTPIPPLTPPVAGRKVIPIRAVPQGGADGGSVQVTRRGFFTRMAKGGQMIDAGVITVDLRSRRVPSGTSRETHASQRTHAQSHGQLARSLGSCREVVPLVFSLCPCAHLVTLDAAERAAAGLAEDERRTVDGCLAERALMLEALLENIRVLALDASKLVCVPVQADSLAAYAKARAGFSGVIRTSGTTRHGAVDEDALLEAHRLVDRLTADCGGLWHHWCWHFSRSLLR
ncbi:MAG: [NiFe]-hydrogenase assembly chaperone HybE [Sutterella wadsworthensis]